MKLKTSLLAAAAIVLTLTGNLHATTCRKTAVIRIEFSDSKFTRSESGIQATLDFAKAYFDEQYRSAGITYEFTLPPVVSLNGNLSYSAADGTDGYDRMFYMAVISACRALDSTVDFSEFNWDSDNQADGLMFIVAAPSQADTPSVPADGSIMPCHDNLSSHQISYYVDHVFINQYSVCVQDDNVGTFCHEFGHLLGLPDFYDTDGDGSGGLARGLWKSLSLMDRGRHNCDGQNPPDFCAVELDYLGLGTAVDMEPGQFTLKPMSKEQRYLRHTSCNGESFLFECRDCSGRDEGTGGDGMVIYHVDRSDNDAGYSDWYKRTVTALERWDWNQVNCRPDRQCASVVEADPEGAGSLEEVFFPQPDVTSFSVSSGFSFVGSGNVPYALTGIRKNTDGSVSFNVVTPITFSETETYQDAAILSWTVDKSLCPVKEAGIAWWKDGEKLRQSQTAGDCATLERLDPLTTYYAQVRIIAADGLQYDALTSFKTKMAYKYVPAYICLSTAERDAQGRFKKGTRLPLRVINATDAAEVVWTLDGKSISTDGGWYTVETSGELRACVYYEDGRTETIIKQIELQ